ncbi:hypothetical protein CFHF_14490 [Caulobacter flavus]|uniref:Uncharacterized protein n=1 Tax=Caulobacter flavus TaxID=1679497 RepID=A0A2N5CSE8_9CAUL|nr:hypothetical protein C1707_23755 [Caulobacter flavus]PLR13386.1 hypothetical protein CFHF_14490 [Caulobacter flavus]
MVNYIAAFMPQAAVLIENLIAPHLTPSILRTFVRNDEVRDAYVGKPHIEQRFSLGKSELVG